MLELERDSRAAVVPAFCYVASAMKANCCKCHCGLCSCLCWYVSWQCQPPTSQRVHACSRGARLQSVGEVAKRRLAFTTAGAGRTPVQGSSKRLQQRQGGSNLPFTIKLMVGSRVVSAWELRLLAGQTTRLDSNVHTEAWPLGTQAVRPCQAVGFIPMHDTGSVCRLALNGPSGSSHPAAVPCQPSSNPPLLRPPLTPKQTVCFGDDPPLPPLLTPSRPPSTHSC